MKKSHFVFWLFGVILATTAHADTYTINFTATSGTTPTAGTFTFNGSTFSAFSLNFAGAQIDFLTSVATTAGPFCGEAGEPGIFDLMTHNTPLCAVVADNPKWEGSSTGSPATFSFFGNDGVSIDAAGTGATGDMQFGVGTWTVTDTTTSAPEPTTVILLLTVIAAVALGVGRPRQDAIGSNSFGDRDHRSVE